MADGEASRSCPMISLILPVALVLFWVSTAEPTEEYADSTGRDCSVCHLAPGGGGELTDVGKGFLLSLAAVTNPQHGKVPGRPKASSAHHYIRLGIGYLHLLTALLWFGTILYVHLILKPAYASRGLPPGEVRVGLASMAVMAVSGGILSAYRVPSVSFLVTTRFGILLVIKISLFLVMVVLGLYAVFFIGPRLRKQRAAQTTAVKAEMTLEELSPFDGKEGRPAYLAYGGNVFDVTKSPFWQKGAHMGRHQAGTDLTAMLAQAPHGEDKILPFPQRGKLIAGRIDRAQESIRRTFYAISYLNLVLVFLITLIVALWRWG